MCSVSGFALLFLQRGQKTLDKAVSAERLRQIANRSGRQCLRARLLVGECREENERNSVTPGTQLILQLDAAQTGHLDVCHYAGEIIKAVRPQELFGRRERVHNVSERPNKAVGRGTYGFIIVNDCHKWTLRQIDLSLMRRLRSRSVTVAVTSDCTTD